MKKKSVQTNKKIIKFLLFSSLSILFVLILGYLLVPSSTKQLSQLLTLPTPTPLPKSWDISVQKWKTYSDSRITLQYPPDMFVQITTTEPNIVSKKRDALIVDIWGHDAIGISFRIEPIYKEETVEQWLTERRLKEGVNCPTCNQFIYPSEDYVLAGIKGRKDIVGGMLARNNFYFLLGNNIIWVPLGNREGEEGLVAKNFKKINLQVN